MSPAFFIAFGVALLVFTIGLIIMGLIVAHGEDPMKTICDELYNTGNLALYMKLACLAR